MSIVCKEYRILIFNQLIRILIFNQLSGRKGHAFPNKCNYVCIIIPDRTIPHISERVIRESAGNIQSNILSTNLEL